jgi:beta-lactam-binding protein with PASTA domain
MIVSTRPGAGTAGRSGDRVSVQVADSSLIVPVLLGRSFPEAVRVLAAAGFRSPDTMSQYRPGARIGTVVGVAPSDGALVPATTRVVLTLARNTPDAPVVVDTSRSPPAGRTCVVPRLKDLSEAAASRALISAKLQVGKVSHSEAGKTVTQQSLAPGLKVTCGTAVDFVIGSIGE